MKIALAFQKFSVILILDFNSFLVGCTPEGKCKMLMVDRVEIVVLASDDLSEIRAGFLALVDFAGNRVNVAISGDFVDKETKEEIVARSAMVTGIGYKFADILVDGFPAEIALSNTDFILTITGTEEPNVIWENDKFGSIAQKIAMAGKISLSQVYELANMGKSVKEIKEIAISGEMPEENEND